MPNCPKEETLFRQFLPNESLDQTFFPFNLSLRLRNVYRLADHQAAVKNEHQSDRVEFENGALSN